MAAFATTRPFHELSVDASGIGWPVAQVVMYARYPGGTAVMFSEYARALNGMLQVDAGMGKSRVEPPAMRGAPNVPDPMRVSATRQGVTVTKRRPMGADVVPCWTMLIDCPATKMDPTRSPFVFGATVKLITLDPNRELESMVIQVLPETAVHEHPSPVETLIAPVPPAETKGDPD